MKANVDMNHVVYLIERLDNLKDQAKAIPSNPVETPVYQEMLKTLEELRKAMYGE